MSSEEIEIEAPYFCAVCDTETEIAHLCKGCGCIMHRACSTAIQQSCDHTDTDSYAEMRQNDTPGGEPLDRIYDSAMCFECYKAGGAVIGKAGWIT